jgi:diguanylate cyclase
VGRIGGEEFGVFLKGANLQIAQIVAERIRRAIERATFMPDGAAHPLSVSVGGAFYDTPISFSDLFRIADQTLYGAKQSGRNRVIVADAGDPQASAAA